MDAKAMQDMDLDPEVREVALKRVKAVRRHVESVARMLANEPTYCIDILKKIRATENALDRVSDMLLRSHLEHAVTVQGDDDIGRMAARSWARLTPCLSADHPDTSAMHDTKTQLREPLPASAE